jgi:two-component system, chemotaxis family, protein-glutamate methylesterase/glutaminase
MIMPKIRVLVVDDSVVIRRLLTEYLSSDPDIEVVGTAPDGKIGLAKISQINPDLVTLDIEMPVMDGLETLVAIRKSYKNLPVIMFSTLTERGASASLDALALGASDYATKPTNLGPAKQNVFGDLIPKIKALCHREPIMPKVVPARTSPLAGNIPITRATPFSPIDIVAIGVSTGGPTALAAVIPNLRRNFPTPVVIVQHMPKMFTRLLAERLASVSGFSVHEGNQGRYLQPGEMWVAPGEFHMDVERLVDGVRLRTHEDPPENSCRPAVDVLFRSVAKAYGSRVLAVVLTGMGQDGLRGCEAIREAGGRVLVQDEASSVVWGMPGAVYRAGLAEKALPLPELAAEINRIVTAGSGRKDIDWPNITLTKEPCSVAL